MYPGGGRPLLTLPLSAGATVLALERALPLLSAVLAVAALPGVAAPAAEALLAAVSAAPASAASLAAAPSAAGSAMLVSHAGPMGLPLSGGLVASAAAISAVTLRMARRWARSPWLASSRAAARAASLACGHDMTLLEALTTDSKIPAKETYLQPLAGALTCCHKHFCLGLQGFDRLNTADEWAVRHHFLGKVFNTCRPICDASRRLHLRSAHEAFAAA